MSHLKSLAIVAVPRRAEVDPRLVRRQRLIERLEEQRRLASDPDHMGRFMRRQKQPTVRPPGFVYDQHSPECVHKPL